MNNIRQIINERLENARNDYYYLQRNSDGSDDYKLSEIIGQMEAYADVLNLVLPAPRTEADILNDFEKLGYVVKDYGEYITFKLGRIEVMDIWKTSKSYEIIQGLNITMQEHKLLNELFICWGWL